MKESIKIALANDTTYQTDLLNIKVDRRAILTAKDGLNWTRLLKPVYRFSFKKFFYRRLKEFDGPERNKLSMNDCLKLASNNNLNLEEIINSNIISFKKQN